MDKQPAPRRIPTFRKWLRYFFAVWILASTTWMVVSYRTSGVAPEMLVNDNLVIVEHTDEYMSFLPTVNPAATGLLFIVGGGVGAEAYAPMLRPIAEQGFPVYVVKLPLRLAPLESQKNAAVNRAKNVINRHTETQDWVLSGHSLGAALACRLAAEGWPNIKDLVLVGTSHPKKINLSGAMMPITKISATHDGVATAERIQENRHLLPQETTWVEIKGGNHAQFAHYGRQLFDGAATISRQDQQDQTREVLLASLRRAD